MDSMFSIDKQGYQHVTAAKSAGEHLKQHTGPGIPPERHWVGFISIRG